jgi:peroxiredoxin
MAGAQGNVFQHAEQLLREGRELEARSLLVEYIRQDPTSVHAWWLLSQLLKEEGQQMDCLERVLMFDPNHVPARTRLTKFKEELASEPSAPPFFKPSAPDTLRQETTSVNRDLEIAPAAALSQPRPIQRNSMPGRSSARMDWILLITSFMILMCIVIGGFGFMAATQLQLPTIPLFASQPTAVPAAYVPQTLPPTWTATVTRTPLPSATLISAETSGYSTPDQLFKLTGPLTGFFVPSFTLKDVVSGNQVSISNYNGHPVIIFFWATWCPHCANEMSPMQSVYKEYKDKGLAVLAVDVGESAAQARSYRNSHSLTFMVLNDSNQAVARQYHITAFPTNFFVYSSGRISSIVVGEFSYASLNSEVKSLLSSVP